MIQLSHPYTSTGKTVALTTWTFVSKVHLKSTFKKIVTSGPITSWQIDGETMETVTDFIFLGSKLTADGDCSHEIKKHLLLEKKTYDKPRVKSMIFKAMVKAFTVSEKAMAPPSSTLAWKIPWTEEPGRLWSMGSLRVRHDWATSLSLFTFTHLRRKWQPTPVFLPGESQGRGSLVGCCLWGHTESDMTEVT